MQSNDMKKLYLVALLLAGFAIGAWHHNLGATSIFVFKGDESVFTWLAMLLGPLSTFPATAVAIFSKKVGGHWLVGGGLLSPLFIGAGGELTIEQIGSWLVMISAPMLVIGSGLLLLMSSRSENACYR
jgi:hypothetical protein